MDNNGEKSFPAHRHRAQSIIQWNSLDQLEDEAINGLYENVDYYKGSLKRTACSEIFYGYVWWTSFQIITSHFSHPFIFNPSIPPLVSFLLIGSFILLPCLLFIATRIQLLVTCPSVLFVSRLFTVLPIIVQNQAVGQLLKLFIICVGGSATVLAVIGNWWSMSTIDRHRKTFYHFLGLILLISMKLWLVYINPLLTGTYFSNIGITLAILVIIALFVFDERTPLLKADESKTQEDTDRHLWAWLGVGFGCHMFIIQLLYIDATILPGWSGITGISLWPCLVVLSMCFGISCGIERNIQFLASSQWLVVGMISFFLFLSGHTFYSFTGAVILTVYISGAWPLLTVILKESLSVLIGFFVYIFFVKISCYDLLWWPVSQWLLLPAIILQWIALKKWMEFGIQTGKIKNLYTTKCGKKNRRGSHIVVLGHIIRRLSTVSEIEDEEEEEENGRDKERSSVHRERLRELQMNETIEMKIFNRTILIQVSMVLCVVALLGSAFSHPLLYPVNNEINSTINVTILSLNAGYDHNGRYNSFRIAELITHLATTPEVSAHVVCLFDVSREFTGGGVAHISMIGHQVGMQTFLSQQRNPRLAILTNIIVISNKSSDREGVTLTLGSKRATPLMISCRTSEPLIESDAPSLLVSEENISTLTHHYQVVNKANDYCHSSVVYNKGLEKIAVNCFPVDANTNVTTITIKQLTTIT